ncbi:hypothetical protein ACOMHN_027281 [Nucella lapillus]
MLLLAVVLTLLGVAVSRPSNITKSYEPISQEDRDFLSTLPTHRGSYPAGFKEAYLSLNGTLVHGPKPPGNFTRIMGSPKSTVGAMNLVAGYITKMFKYAPPEIFASIVANNAGLGVFRKAEKLTIFPEYAALRDTPECKGMCNGTCKITCTRDGRKWDTVAGLSGGVPLGLVMEENVLCVDNIYSADYNVAVHEFAHVINRFGFDKCMKKMKKDAYINAKANNLWRQRSYAMMDDMEYFAEATGAFFLVNKLNSTGGMNDCYPGPNKICRTEMEARRHIQQVDPQLYTLLSYVYTDNRPQLHSHLTACPHASVVG